MSIRNLLSTANDALAAQSFGLDVTGQNVSNVNTPGYVRRSALLETRGLPGASAGGVNIKGISRSVDTFLDQRSVVASGLSAYAQSHDTELAGLQSLYNDTTGQGLSDKVSKLFASFGALSSNPNDPTTRATVLANASAFAQALRDTSASIATRRQDELTQAQQSATQVNDLAQRIAKLNTQIGTAEGVGQDASDLRDQRGNLISQLSQYVDVHTFTDGSGKFVVRSAGTTLVEGDLAATMSVSLDNAGNLKVLAQRGNSPPADVTTQLSGGKLYGLQQARDVDATAMQTKLDQFAFDVATAVNTQHAAGFGLDGVSGRNLFSVQAVPGSASTITLDPLLDGHPERLAASDTAANVPGGTANATALSILANQKIATGNTRTPIEAYSDIVGDVGARKAASQADVSLRAAQADQAKAMRDSVSGVSLDEEMVSLTKYQRAYEAASKLVKTADDLLAGLMQTI